METLARVPLRKSFNDVCGNRVGGFSKLAAQFESLEGRKLSERQAMELDEERVGSLPGN
jgi:hypothetical protein